MRTPPFGRSAAHNALQLHTRSLHILLLRSKVHMSRPSMVSFPCELASTQPSQRYSIRVTAGRASILSLVNPYETEMIGG